MVRKASIEDIEIISNFKTKLSMCKLKYDNPSLDIINNNVNLDEGIYLIAVKNNKDVGYLYGYKSKDKAILDQIYIIDNYRESGLGQELVSEFINWASNNSLKNIEVNIENGNEAYFLFDKLGFEITKVIMNVNI